MGRLNGKNARDTAKQLHMTPNIIRQIAASAKVKKLVLSHTMLRTLGKEKETKREVRKAYRGSMAFANDKSYYRVK